MERHFGFPIAIAAAIHGALLFGFNGGTRSRSPAITRTMVTTCDLLVVPEELLVVAEESADAERSNSTTSERDELVPRRPTPELAGIEPELAIPQPVSARPAGVGFRHDVMDTSGMISGWGGSVISSLALDDPPRARLQSAPLFPHTARREGVSGEVTVEFVVDEEGRVLAPRVVSSSREVFEEPTLRAVAKWRFHPGRSGGRLVRFRMVVPVVFTVAE